MASYTALYSTTASSKRLSLVAMHMVKYTIEVEDELWTDWKDTVPRSKTLNDRIVELIENDRE